MPALENWSTCKSTVVLSLELFKQHGIRISDKTVAKLLRDQRHSLQAPNKSVEGAEHPDRNAQFEHIKFGADFDHAAGGARVIKDATWKQREISSPSHRTKVELRCQASLR